MMDLRNLKRNWRSPWFRPSEASLLTAFGGTPGEGKITASGLVEVVEKHQGFPKVKVEEDFVCEAPKLCLHGPALTWLCRQQKFFFEYWLLPTQKFQVAFDTLPSPHFGLLDLRKQAWITICKIGQIIPPVKGWGSLLPELHKPLCSIRCNADSAIRDTEILSPFLKFLTKVHNARKESKSRDLCSLPSIRPQAGDALLCGGSVSNLE